MTGDAPIQKMTRAYMKIRDARAELSRKFKEEDGDLKAQQETLKAALLAHFDENGVESVRTNAGLVYRTTKTRYWAKDWAAVYDYALEHKMMDLFEKRLAQGVVKQLVEDEGAVLPGVNADTEYVVTVRKN